MHSTLCSSVQCVSAVAVAVGVGTVHSEHEPGAYVRGPYVDQPLRVDPVVGRIIHCTHECLGGEVVVK